MKFIIIGVVAAFAGIVFVEAGGIYPSDLVSYWKFDDAAGTAALDAVGANHGSLVSDPVRTAGRVAGALLFDGANDYVEVPDSASLDIAGSEITIEAWIYPNSVANENVILKKGVGVGGCGNYNLFVRSGTLALLSSDSCDWANAGQNAVVSTGAWQHIAATYDGARIRYYVNGELKDTIARDGLGAPNSDSLTIGGPPIAGWNDSRYFQGSIDEAAIWHEALGGEVLRQHYLNGLDGWAYVLEPHQEALQGLAQTLEDMDLQPGIEKSLAQKLEICANMAKQGFFRQAAVMLEGFIGEVKGLSGKKLTQKQAEQLINSAKGLQQLLSQL